MDDELEVQAVDPEARVAAARPDVVSGREAPPKLGMASG